MNFVLIFCVSFILIIIVLFLLFSKKDNKSQLKNQKMSQLSNSLSKSSKKNIDFSFIKIPRKISEIEALLLQKDCKNLFDNFKALAYNKKDKLDLSLVEWNNWEVFMLLALLKVHKDIFIPNPQEVFIPSIVSLSILELNKEMNKIFQKSNKIDINLTNDVLRNQINWSVREVSIIFYYLSIYKS